MTSSFEIFALQDHHLSQPTMRTVEIAEPGGPEVLRMGERPRPVPQPGEVLIRVHAAGLNGADLIQRQGHYPPPEGASDILGLEVSGEIAALGDGVADMQIGDRVCALLGGGGYAEYCTVPTAQVLTLPDHIDYIQGAALIETAATVTLNLFELAHLTSGEKLLVHGGTSGIGTTAIQLARLAGVDVYCTVGSPEKAKAAEVLGATRAINYREQSFSEIIRDHTEDGVDVILDMIGAPYLENNLKSLRRGGRLVFIAYKGGRLGELDIARVMIKQLTVTGSTLRSQPPTKKAEIVEKVRQRVWPHLLDESFRPIVDRTYAIEDAAKAHAAMEQGGHIGKIVLTIT